MNNFLQAALLIMGSIFAIFFLIQVPFAMCVLCGKIIDKEKREKIMVSFFLSGFSSIALLLFCL